VAVDRGSHPDLKYIRHEKPATIGVDDVREQLNGDIVIRPYRADRKIYIIDEAELLNVQAQNAILKTIEEPPSYAVILLLSNNRDVFLETIRSRSVLVEFLPLRREDVAKYVEAHFPPTAERSFALDHCRGNIGRALHLMENEDAREFVTAVHGILEKLPQLSVVERMKALEELSQDREDVKEVLELFLAWYRDVAVFKATGDAKQVQSGDRNISKIEQAAQAYSFAALGRIFEKVRETKELLLANVNPESVFENLLLECGVAG
ncbi:MAG: DNA polymerase III subunit delta, partial [Lachnospiraceae bacterium]|nr:DNA polymerase III subunit delta [Lachnospiraceae bacterium]